MSTPNHAILVDHATLSQLLSTESSNESRGVARNLLPGAQKRKSGGQMLISIFDGATCTHAPLGYTTEWESLRWPTSANVAVSTGWALFVGFFLFDYYNTKHMKLQWTCTSKDHRTTNRASQVPDRWSTSPLHALKLSCRGHHTMLFRWFPDPNLSSRCACIEITSPRNLWLVRIKIRSSAVAEKTRVVLSAYWKYL